MFASRSAPTEVSGGAVGMMDVASAMRSLMVGGWVGGGGEVAAVMR